MVIELPASASELAGWLPAVILPFSTGLQLAKVLRARTAAGNSALAWVLFGVANVGAYVFAGQPFAPQAILAFLVTAVLDVALAAACFLLPGRPPQAATTTA